MYPYSTERTSFNDNTVSISTQSMSSRKNSQNKPDKKILDMIEVAICDEETDSNYYKQLMNMARNPYDKEVIRSIYLDEIKHKKYLEEIYTILAGHSPKKQVCEEKIPSNNLLKEYEKSIFGELSGVEFYRQLYFAILNLEIRDMLFEIITDEQKHAAKFTYLFSKK